MCTISAIYFPSIVNVYNIDVRYAIIKNINTDVGIPNIFSLPIILKLSDSPRIGTPLANFIPRPLSAVSIASVTVNDGTFPLAIIDPTERSMLPLIITNVIPRDTVPMMDTCLNMF